MADSNNFSNVLAAMQGNQSVPAIQPNLSGSSPDLWSDNYNTFSKLTKAGINLESLVSKIDSMDAEIKELKSKPKEPSASFIRMEKAVKDVSSVVAAKQKIADERNRIITELCSKDAQFIQAVEAYKQAVNDAYVARVEDDLEDVPVKKKRTAKVEPEQEYSDQI